MARTRKLKPGYNESQAISRLSFAARLLDISLWPYLDGNGMIQNSPSLIKGKVFPLDDIDSGEITVLLKELVTGGRLFSLEVDKKLWFYRKDFRKEQRVYSDEPKLTNIDKEILDAIDAGNTLPEENVNSVAIQPQLFATSPSTFTSTSPSTQSSKFQNVDKFPKRPEWSPAPSGFFEKFKTTIFGKQGQPI